MAIDEPSLGRKYARMENGFTSDLLNIGSLLMMVMNLPLLSQFQGAFMGAAIADLIAMNAFDADRPESGWGDRSNHPGALMVTVATCLISGQLDTDDGHHQWTQSSLTLATAEGTIPLSRAIALLPMALFLHDHIVDANAYSQRIDALAIRQGIPLQVPLSAAELCIGLTLALILNRRFHPTTHIPTLLTLMQDRPQASGSTYPIDKVLTAVHEGMINWRGAAFLNQSFSQWTRTPLGAQSASRNASGLDDPQLSDEYADAEAIALGLILYCFLSTPQHYGLAMGRLRQLLQQWAFPPSIHPIACILMGTLLGSYSGVWHLPFQYRYPLRAGMHCAHTAEALQCRWTMDEQALLSLGHLLWALWAGVDKIRVESLRRDKLYGLEFVTAPIQVIRVFGS